MSEELGVNTLETAVRSKRTVQARPHLHGSFPDDIRVGWCTGTDAGHQTLELRQATAIVGRRERDVRWNVPEALGELLGASSTLASSRYLEVQTNPELAGAIHDCVQVRPLTQASDVSPPLGLHGQLFPYQLQGYHKLRQLVASDVGGLLCDEMGLGKTLQAIAVLLSQREAGTSLVIVPASLLTNWEREMTTFAPSLRVLRHSGSDRTGVAGSFASRDVVLTTYETAVNDAVFMEDVPWNLLVLDEAQRVKNPTSIRARSLKRFKARAAICITGTPVENSLSDLWSLTQVCVPQLLGSFDAFARSYTDDRQSAEALGRITAPLTVRRRVADVATDLPAIRQFVVAVDMDDVTRSEYAAALSGGTGFENITRLRVAAAHATDGAMDLREVAKGQILDAMISEIVGRAEKMLIFASFQKTLDRIHGTVTMRYPSACSAVIDGRLEPDLRQRTIDAFASFDGPGVLIMNPQAAGVGLNITAANHVVHFNPEWNPAITKQATARAYRRRQLRTVHVHHLYYANSIEDDVINTSEFKEMLAMGVAAGHDEDEG